MRWRFEFAASYRASGDPRATVADLGRFRATDAATASSIVTVL
jgi:hypothetical protein